MLASIQPFLQGGRFLACQFHLPGMTFLASRWVPPGSRFLAARGRCQELFLVERVNFVVLLC